jgi:hypothetical protein
MNSIYHKVISLDFEMHRILSMAIPLLGASAFNAPMSLFGIWI